MNVWDKIGRSRVLLGLADQMASGEVAHAWLLVGPSGSGKTSAALAMAASLCCPVQPGVGCGTCTTCARIVRRRHPDVHHVVAEGAIIPVDLIREVVLPEAARSPFEARNKVFVIEEADRMNPPAQNALLKTLEEPQQDTIFILLTDDEDDVLETIRSRCRIVRLEPVPESRIIEMLEDDGVPADTALLSARLADGDFERARTLGEDEVAMARRGTWVSIPARLRSPVDAQDLAAEILAEAKTAVKEREKAQKQELTDLAESMGEGRGTGGARTALGKRHKRELKRLEEEVLGEALTSLASFYKDVLVVQAGGTEGITNLDLLPELEAWAGSGASPAALLRAAERCIEVRASFVNNANVSLAIEAALLEISALLSPVESVSGW